MLLRTNPEFFNEIGAIKTLWAQPKSSGLGPIQTLVGNCSNIRGGGTGHAILARISRKSSVTASNSPSWGMAAAISSADAGL